MTAYEVVSLNKELLKRLHKIGIKTDDYKWLGIYGDYARMKSKGDKTSYVDEYHGLFSRRLAKWAISLMEVKDPSSGQMKPISTRSVDDVVEILTAHGVKLPDEYIYTAWYLYHMAIADYPKTLKTDEQRAHYVEETILDPDGYPTNVLSCFEAKMCNAEIPIYWERML